MLNFLTVESIIKINAALGYTVLNRNSVGSVLSSWHYYSDSKHQVAAIVRGIVKNHPFQDGNKSTATVVYYTCCEILNLKPLSDAAMFNCIVDIASHNYSVEQITTKLFK